MAKENKKRKKPRSFDDLFEFPEFEEFENMFKEMRERMLKLMEDFEDYEIKGPKSVVYGFNITIDPQGNVEIKRFGDFPKKKTDKDHEEIKSFREPLVEMHKDEKKVIVIAELPGVDEKDIEIKLEGKILVIKAKNKITNKEYYKEMQLPYECKIKSKTYKNGILEIDLERA
jgi:HSP20 family protein